MGTVAHLYNYGFVIPGRPGMAGEAVVRQWQRSEVFMLADLAKSGLEPEDICCYPMSVGLPARSSAAYVIPYYNLEGALIHRGEQGISHVMHRVRIQYPDTLPIDTPRPKYIQPSARELANGQHNLPYVRPEWWKGTSPTGYIVEGEKKAAALAKRWGVRVLGIGGCDNWHDPDPENRHGLHPWIIRAVETVRRVVVIPDGDIRRLQINRAYHGLVAGLRQLDKEVELIQFNDKIDEWLVAHEGVGLEVLDTWARYPIAQMAQDRDTLVRDYNLVTRGERAIWPNEYNVTQLLRGHPAYRGTIRLDQDRLRIVDEKGAPHGVNLVADIQTHMQSVLGMPDLKLAIVRAAMEQVANENSFSGRKLWLESLKWDGVKRLGTWVVRALKCENTPQNRIVGQRALIAAVARVMKPGCFVDYMVILQGKQGIGKSSAVRLLFGPDNTLEYTRGGLEGKDIVMAMHKCWAFVDEEIGMLVKADQIRLKGFITKKRDIIRLPYARDTVELDRRSVIYGTTNKEIFLPADESGYRRFAVLKMLGNVDFKYLTRYREQLWAEAVVAYGRNLKYKRIPEDSEKHAADDLLLEQVRDMLKEHFREQDRLRTWWRGKYWIPLTLAAYKMEDQKVHTSDKRYVGEKLSALSLIRDVQATIGGKHYNSVYSIAVDTWRAHIIGGKEHT